MKFILRQALCISFLLSSFSLTRALLGPIGTDRPAPAGGSIKSDQPPNSFYQGSSPPYPTNDWWASAGAGDGDAILSGPFPFESSLAANGIQFGISTSRDFDGVSIHQPTQVDWIATFTEHSGNMNDHKALSWDSQSVTVQYFTGSSSLTTYLVPGSPYMTFSFANATPKFTSGKGGITSFAGQSISEGGNITASGSHFLVINEAGTYIIYSLTGSISLMASSDGTITADGASTGVLRLAMLGSPNHQALLDAHSAVYPTGVDTDYSFTGDSATLKFTWSVQGGNPADLLMLTWPHHRIKMQSPNFPSADSLSYLTTKGYMYPSLGNTWSMQYDLPTITWNAPRSPDSSCLNSLISGLEYEISNLGQVEAPGDFYFWGGHIAIVSRLALIADHVGRSDLIQKVTDYLKGNFIYWFNSASPTQSAYETAWGGMINRAGADNVFVDFGNGYYNDHHFHYGYFLAAASVIARYDKDWLNNFGDTVTWFMRDIVNPSRSDPWFPLTRTRDWFAGHSWASGIASGGGSRDQESVGEAVNGYYGSLLWADILGNTDIKNYARLLIATEQHAAQVYWHLYPDANPTDRDQPYPEQEFRNIVTVGNVEDWQSGAWLFWGDQKVEIAAIQILPVTPINEYMYDATWARNMFEYAQDEINDPTIADDWKSVIYLAYSQVDVHEAARRSSLLTTWGSGNSFSNQLYFLSTRPGASGVCDSTTGNPVGRFAIQDVASGNFAAEGSLPDMLFSTTSQEDAAVFNLAEILNAGSIQAASTSMFVTADQSGSITLSAIRDTASTWETFIIRPKTGAALGIYSILAASNKNYLTVGDGNALLNNAETEDAGAGFRLVSV